MFVCFRNPTWWKRRSAMERGLTVIAVSGVLLCIGLAIGIGVLVSNSASCDATTTAAGKYRSRGILAFPHLRSSRTLKYSYPPMTLSTINHTINYTATQKSQELFRRKLYSRVFWRAESDFEFKIAPDPINFGHNLKKRYFRVYDGKILYHYGF